MAPAWRTSSSGSPSRASVSANRATAAASDGSAKSPYSFSQERRIFMGGARSELLDEAEVVGEHVADVGELVAHLGHAVDAEAEREPAPLLGIDAARPQHIGMDHAAST